MLNYNTVNDKSNMLCILIQDKLILNYFDLIELVLLNIYQVIVIVLGLECVQRRLGVFVENLYKDKIIFL